MMPVIFEPGGDHGEVEAEAWRSPEMVMMPIELWHPRHHATGMAWHSPLFPISEDL